MEARGEGVPEVVVTGRSRFVGGKEEGSGSGGIGQRVEARQGGGNVPRKDDGPGMRAGVQSRDLT